ncbi:aldehyde dehydrogenase family protein [Frondihabitans australicus]|uniref:Acyl-CoA reductase-like NAD-dependent aldehyde dehydrogenase n=1 Tax=Frondihabitans australicus TaxID=386892 RepID=A0A495IIJ3_9MICO|nr:aldehyde dehydrogenase family protein [Frondihabitans australicus]RKR75862.1 acyl-CoA reductase-like NAD-dependent aldehyde dehydrogenase [Frondihabitans australicus]
MASINHDPSRFQFAPLTTSRWSSDDPANEFDVDNPATGQVITRVAGSSAAEVDAAIDAAHAAFTGGWRNTTAAERSALLARCADALEAHADELAEILTAENGKPLADGRFGDVQFLLDIFRFYAGIVDKIPSDFFEVGPVYASTVLEPFGVVGAIIPFNWPPIHTGGKVAAALAVGNTVVVKPGPQSPLTIMRIIDIISEVLPADVVHVIPGGAEPGRALVANPLVRKISFTGSTRGGMAVAAAAAANVTPVTLELGGKNAFVVFDDADLDLAVRNALEGGFFNKGEACTAASRVLVQRGIADEFTKRLADGVRSLRVGEGIDPKTVVGPAVSRDQQQRDLDYIRIGEEEGATIVAQANLPADDRLSDGFWVPPTLFAGVTRTMRIAQEEIFGPVQTINVFDTEDEAVDIVNESPYGLVAAVYSQDQATAFRVARRMEAGMVHVNNYHRWPLTTPFGGVKHSGYGREHTMATLQEFGAVKMIRFPTGLTELPSWRGTVEVFGHTGSVPIG